MNLKKRRPISISVSVSVSVSVWGVVKVGDTF